MKLLRKHVNNVVSMAVTGGLAFHATGCSLFVGSMQPVTITASDPAAEIYVDGRMVGRGSVTLKLKRNRSHGVMARVGDRSGAAHIGKVISPTGVLDLVGGLLILIPFLGVVGPGFWALDPDNVQIPIPPDREAEHDTALNKAAFQPIARFFRELRAVHNRQARV